MMSARPRRDAYHFLRHDHDAVERSRRSAAALLVGPVEVLADAVADNESDELRWLLPEHRRDLVHALAGNAEARRRLLVHAIPMGQ